MIIGSEKDLTQAVLEEYARIKNPRLREIMAAFIRHLHAFAREVRLTEQEFHAAMAYIVQIGKQSSDTHNEAVLMAGSLGLSSHQKRRFHRALAHAGSRAVRRRGLP